MNIEPGDIFKPNIEPGDIFKPGQDLNDLFDQLHWDDGVQ
jgi:hypothetical protein